MGIFCTLSPTLLLDTVLGCLIHCSLAIHMLGIIGKYRISHLGPCIDALSSTEKIMCSIGRGGGSIQRKPIRERLSRISGTIGGLTSWRAEEEPDASAHPRQDC